MCNCCFKKCATLGNSMQGADTDPLPPCIHLISLQIKCPQLSCWLARAFSVPLGDPPSTFSHHAGFWKLGKEMYQLNNGDPEQSIEKQTWLQYIFPSSSLHIQGTSLKILPWVNVGVCWADSVEMSHQRLTHSPLNPTSRPHYTEQSNFFRPSQ